MALSGTIARIKKAVNRVLPSPPRIPVVGKGDCVVEPDADTLPALDRSADDARRRAVDAGAAAADRVLAAANGPGLAELIERAVVD